MRRSRMPRPTRRCWAPSWRSRSSRRRSSCRPGRCAGAKLDLGELTAQLDCSRASSIVTAAPRARAHEVRAVQQLGVVGEHRDLLPVAHHRRRRARARDGRPVVERLRLVALRQAQRERRRGSSRAPRRTSPTPSGRARRARSSNSRSCCTASKRARAKRRSTSPAAARAGLRRPPPRPWRPPRPMASCRRRARRPAVPTTPGGDQDRRHRAVDQGAVDDPVDLVQPVAGQGHRDGGRRARRCSSRSRDDADVVGVAAEQAHDPAARQPQRDEERAVAEPQHLAGGSSPVDRRCSAHQTAAAPANSAAEQPGPADPEDREPERPLEASPASGSGRRRTGRRGASRTGAARARPSRRRA